MCDKFNTFFYPLLFFFFYFFFLSSFSSAYAQNKIIDDKIIKISELNFPYQNDLVITYSAKKVFFDNYNFPKETSFGTTKYDFNNYKQNILKVIYTEHFKKDSFEYISYLQINKSGMTYWFAENDSIKLKKHTLAISLPLYKGKIWSTYINDIKSKATCLSVDTIISTPLGNLSVFAIKYLIHINKKSTKSIDHYIAFTEFYNQKYGKIRMHVLEYSQMKDNNRIVKYREEENTISRIIIPENK
jgi:hypothetical protein